MKLRILNETGHTELEVSASEVIDQINDHPTHWVFVDGEMVSREQINTVDWETVESVDLTPAIVGGQWSLFLGGGAVNSALLSILNDSLYLEGVLFFLRN